MGRAKPRLRRIESKTGRQVTYSKRRTGILKKAKDLSVLCDVNVLLLMCSPSGRPTFFHGGSRGIEPVLAKFALLAPQERARRNLESLQTLKKTLEKTKNDADVAEFSRTSSTTYEAVKVTACEGSQLEETCRRFRPWVNVENIDSLEDLGKLEESLRNSFYQVFLQRIRANDHLPTNSMPQVISSGSNLSDEADDHLMTNSMFQVIRNDSSLSLSEKANDYPLTNSMDRVLDSDTNLPDSMNGYPHADSTSRVTNGSTNLPDATNDYLLTNSRYLMTNSCSNLPEDEAMRSNTGKRHSPMLRRCY